jgi:membrane-associated protein
VRWTVAKRGFDACQDAPPILPAVDAIDPEKLLEAFGTIGLFVIIFAESGLLIGFFLPGDSLLFTAGLFAATRDFGPPFPLLLLGCFIAAVAGDQVGYMFGQRVGPALFRRPDSRFFKQKYVHRANEFFEDHGRKTIVLARFVPIVRTFAPILAGVGKMQYRTFVTFNVIGGFLWAVGVTTAGYVLGDTIHGIDKYLLPIIAVIVLLSVLPPAIEMLRQRRKARALTAAEAEAEADELEHILNDPAD